MVSTRKVKDKFSEGDRVLCYEPDPTKTKVLYDSKILEVKTRKDERGRLVTEYLIHFQGWNPSWDRVVSEDFILRDTDENRQLQKDLAAKARLQIGAYLYRKEQSEKDGTTLSDEIFEKPESGAEEGWVTASDEDDDDIASSVETDDSLDQKVPIELKPNIRLILETDYDLVKRQNKLVKLPSHPNVIEILEAYIRHVASRAFHTDGEETVRPRGRGQNSTPVPTRSKADELVRVSAKINIAKEVVDGLRICFDFYLSSLLLYANEATQFEQVKLGLFPYELNRDGKNVVFSEDEASKSDDPFISSTSGNVHLATEPADVERRRSLRSHKDPAVEPCTSGITISVKSFALLERGPFLKGNHTPVNNSSSAKSCSSASSYCGPLGDGHMSGGGGPLAPEMAQLVKLAETWRLVPDSYIQQQPPPPSTIYGAVHLMRLFVRLPSIIYASNLPDKENQPRHLSEQKLKLLLNHLQSFLTFLEGKGEWFRENQYCKQTT